MATEEDPAATFRRVLSMATDIIGKGGLVFSPVVLPFWLTNDGTPGKLVAQPTFTVGPWAACSRCGGQTRCRGGGVFHRPIHMLCHRVFVRAPRIEPNRHDRRRLGLPRPMAPEWVGDWVVND